MRILDRYLDTPQEVIELVRRISTAYATLPERQLLPEEASVLKRIK